MFVFIFIFIFLLLTATQTKATLCVKWMAISYYAPNQIYLNALTSDCAEPSTHSIIRGSSLSLHQCQEVRMFWKMADVPNDAPERKFNEC